LRRAYAKRCGGELRRRLCVAGLLRAEGKSSDELRRHQAMPALVRALESLVGDREAGNGRGVA
jgi:hypothetical protein